MQTVKKKTKRLLKRARRLLHLARVSIGPEAKYWVSYSDGTTGECFSGEYTPIELRLMQGRRKKRAAADRASRRPTP